jgi:hypothetical protein
MTAQVAALGCWCPHDLLDRSMIHHACSHGELLHGLSVSEPATVCSNLLIEDALCFGKGYDSSHPPTSRTEHLSASSNIQPHVLVTGRIPLERIRGCRLLKMEREREGEKATGLSLCCTFPSRSRINKPTAIVPTHALSPSGSPRVIVKRLVFCQLISILGNDLASMHIINIQLAGK